MLRRIALALAFGSLAAACFSSDGTFGAVCHGDGDCGDDQICRHEICGACGNGAANAGEVCVAEPEPVELGIVAEQIAVVDLDGDGATDLIAGAAGSVVPLLGDGGTFVAGSSVAVAGVVALSSGDADRDGLVDVIAVTSRPGFQVLFGDGHGGLLATEIVTTDVTHALADPSRGVLTASGSSVRVHEIQADRSFVAAESIDFAAAVVALVGPMHIDSDEIADVVVVGDGGATTVLAGTGEGYSVAATEGFGASIRVVRAFDVRDDGRSDLVAVTHEDRIVVLENDGNGGFVAGSAVDTEAGATAVGGGDVNHDGELDVVTAAASGLRLHLQRSTDLQPSTGLPGSGAFTDLVIEPIDDDARVDVLAVGPSTVVVVRGEL